MNTISSLFNFIANTLMTSKGANKVLASPNGSDGQPTYRALVSDDLPNLGAGKITSGTFNAARIPNLSANKITSDTLNSARIPVLPTDKIPTLSANKISGGSFSGLYKVTSHSFSIAAMSANSHLTANDLPISGPSGYNAVGIVGWNSSGWRITPTTHYIKNNTTLFAGFCNPTATATTGATTFYFYVLWLRGTSA